MTEVTISSTAYVLGVTKSKVLSDLYNVFFNRIVNNVTDPQSISRQKWWFPAWPDVNIDNSDSYPIGIINSAEIRWEYRTLTTSWVPGNIEIEIYSTKMSELDNLSSQVINAVETTTDTMRDLKIKFINLESTATSHVMRDKITIHNKVIAFTFKWQFSKTP